MFYFKQNLVKLWLTALIKYKAEGKNIWNFSIGRIFMQALTIQDPDIDSSPLLRLSRLSGGCGGIWSTTAVVTVHYRFSLWTSRYQPTTSNRLTELNRRLLRITVIAGLLIKIFSNVGPGFKVIIIEYGVTISSTSIYTVNVYIT